MPLIEALYTLSAVLLAVYGVNALILSILRWKRREPSLYQNPITVSDLPFVTVQLPIYNERFVVRRLVEAVGKFDYPRDRLQIQVLDDSTDDTSAILDRVLGYLRADGLEAEHIQRRDRVGFKGGALQHGLKTAKGAFIAILDADFIPPPDFLKRTIPHFFDTPELGCLQTRWGHVNGGSSWLTRAQSIGIDGHFVVEQQTRSDTGLFLNFNGTAGIWRRACIEDSGGWHADTLTEDLDLSYRAQLRGWSIGYAPQVVVPGELPPHMNAFKRQQFRWAKGSIQTAKKLLGELWRSPHPLTVKLEGTLHLTNYAVHPLILLNLLLTLPVLLSGGPLLKIVPYFTAAAVGPPLMYWLAMSQEGKDLPHRITHLFALILLGMGLSANNTRAVGEAALGIKSAFLRTPKFNLQGDGSLPQGSIERYALLGNAGAWVEAALALYALGLLVYVLKTGVWTLAFWLAVYTLGFGYVAGLGLLQTFFGGERRSSSA